MGTGLRRAVPPSRPRMVVLGLDSVSPSLLFDRFLPLMPRVKALLSRSTYGTLRTIDPPITVPAWAVEQATTLTPWSGPCGLVIASDLSIWFSTASIRY